MPAGRQILRTRSLRVRLVTVFTPTVGTPTRVTTTIALKRSGATATRRVAVVG